MAFSFDPSANVVVVRMALFGSVAIVGLKLALDTGATQTVVMRSKLETAGYDLSVPLGFVAVATGSRIESVPRFQVDSLMGLDQIRDNFEILFHDLPASPRIDGVLGLDFLRGHRLTLDFRVGEMELV